MKKALKAFAIFAAAALAIGIAGIPASANQEHGMMGIGMSNMHGAIMSGNAGIMGINSGMMGSGMMGTGMMHSMMNGNFNEAMQEMMRGNGTFDMNQMHRAIHGEEPDVDMNAIMKSADFKLFNGNEQNNWPLKMHQRMLSGNLTQEDINEMREHCPMMK